MDKLSSEELWNIAIDLECKSSNEYLNKTTNSCELYNSKAKKYLVGGVGSGYYSLSPYPFYCNKGKHSKLYDIDDNEYIDFSMCLGANIIGHSNPKIIKTIQEQSLNSILFGVTSVSNVSLAERLTELYSLSQWRFMNSGTEATRDAIQVARAIKNIDEIIKVEGGYHGQHESVCVSYHPDLQNENCGTNELPKSIASHPGIPNDMIKKTIVIPFNCSKDSILSQIDSTPNKSVSCIILELILMNCAIIFPEKRFLQDIQDICIEKDIILIIDEVKTNTTVSIHGASKLYNIKPDIICLGKSCSGGIPFGAVGMTSKIAKYVAQSEPSINSTFGGNPLAMACCLTTLNDILTPEIYDYIDSLQLILKDEITKLLLQYSIPGRVYTIGAKGCLVFMDHIPKDYRDWKIHNAHYLDYACHTYLLNNGIWLSGPGEEWTLSILHTKDDILKFIKVFDNFFKIWIENVMSK